MKLRKAAQKVRGKLPVSDDAGGDYGQRELVYYEVVSEIIAGEKKQDFVE